MCNEISEIEKKVFEIEGLFVIFKCVELLNDMKMLVMLGGELFNSVRFFLIFVNVLKDNCIDLKGIFLFYLSLL